jgi:chaperonin GroES
METPKLELEPFFDRVFIERDETVDKTAGGVIIPETEKEKPNKGIVIVAGPDCKSVFPGQKIIFGRDYGFELMIGGREVTVLREGDIYAGSPRPPMAIEEFEKFTKLVPDKKEDEDFLELQKALYDSCTEEINKDPYVPGQFDNRSRQDKNKQ